MALGTLYVVATPLGHLGDLTPRAAEVLRTVPLVAAEDTRRSRKLLHHLGASPRLLSYHAHSPPRRLETLVDLLTAGEDMALVTDAGTPGVSDPGAALAAAVRSAGGRVVPIPGASAVSTALSAAGLPADRYLFLGFLPRHGGERRRLLTRAAAEEWTIVCFEAANRLVTLLTDLATAAGGDRRAVVARELTKIHEEFREGSLEELAAFYETREPRGEITLILRGTGAPPPAPDRTVEATQLVDRLVADGMSTREIVRAVTAELGLPRNEVYRMVTNRP